MGCEAWSLTLRDKVLRRIFELNMDEVSRGWMERSEQ
jgi:hypothetical protein